MRYLNFKNILLFLCFFAFTSCEEETTVDWIPDFELSTSAVNFTNAAGKQSITISAIDATPKARITTPGVDWCTIKMKELSGDKSTLEVSVTENIKVDNRSAQAELVYKGKKKRIMIYQSHKSFDYVPEVVNMQATSKPGSVLLTWEDPSEDNFRYVVVSVYNSQNELIHTEKVEKGVKSILIKGLLSSHGKYSFKVQSFDHENESGNFVETKCAALKRVAFKFKDIPGKKYLGYYFKAGNIETSKLKIGSNEFNENDKITIKFDVDPSLIAKYNSENSQQLEMLPEGSYTLPNFVYSSSVDFQDIEFQINTANLKDRTYYGLPIKIVDASGNEIEAEGSSALLIYQVDDMEGWYTVERLEKCGETADKYPAGKRRFIKRTGEFTWETGYLFGSYSKSETDRAHKWVVQFITINPESKELFIQQGDYPVSESKNNFDPVKQELHIEYLYTQWAGWWTHERMYDRRPTK